MIKGAFCSISTLSMGSIDKVTSGILDKGTILLAANSAESPAKPAPSISPIPKKTYDKPKDPSFANGSANDKMSTQDIAEYTDAHRRAYRQIVASLKNLQKDEKDANYSKWFDDSHDKGRKEKVIANLARMANWMADYSVVFNKTSAYCDVRGFFTDRVASTANNQAFPGPINLCWRAFDNAWLFFTAGKTDKDWTRAFIVIHEASHAAAQTDDVSYDWITCRFTLDADAKVRNAQNYALFAMETSVRALPYVPQGTVDLKTGDIIFLKATNDRYLNTHSYNGDDYIAASTSESDLRNTKETRFFVTVSEDDPSKIFLQSWEKKYLYLAPGDNYIKPDLVGFPSGNDRAKFTVGEFEIFKSVDQNGVAITDKLLVLQASDGTLLAQSDHNPAYIRATNSDVDRWCLFKLTVAARAK
jgi:hypothetical protein